MKNADKLVLTDMTFRACHGVLPVERRRRQEFRVTVELEVSVTRAGRTDSLGDTIDYCAVQAVVREVVEGAHRKLIESLAEDIARRLLSAFPAAQAVVIKLLKPRPPVAFEFGGVQVRIRRTRRGSRR